MPPSLSLGEQSGRGYFIEFRHTRNYAFTPAFLVRNPRASMVQRPAPADDASDQSAPPDLEREPTPMPAALRDKYRKPPTVRLPSKDPPRRRNSLLQHV